MKRYESIIYVNFAPYENAGRILDFLVDNFSLVILFSFDFHELKNYQSNRIKVFRNRKMIKEIKLFKLPTPEFLLFITLPFIAFLIALQTMWYVVKFKRIYGKFNIYLTVNAFTAWVGNILRDLGLVNKTIFWVWDYYPPGYPDWRIKIARFIYWNFDKMSTKSSSSVIFLNERLEALRKEIGVLPKNKKYPTVQIGTNPNRMQFPKIKIIGHIGVLKKSQGLDLFFDNLKFIIQKIPDVKVEIVGSGPDEQHFKTRAKAFPNVKFYGFIEEENRVEKIIKKWSVGLATYIPDKSNEAYWTDPSKIKLYISQGVPVITTAISGFSDEIRKNEAGIVIDYFNPEDLVSAISIILKNQTKFKNNAYNLSRKYDYRILYKKLLAN